MSHPKTLVSLCSLSLLLMIMTTAVAGDDAAVMSNFLKSLTSPPSGWSSSTPFCKWRGVQCDSSGRVTSISLASQSLTGTLPSDLNSLSQLRSLSLQDNALSGPLPSLANLSALQTAYLNGNNFTSVPAAFAGLTSLQTLSLGSNPSLAPWTFPTDLTSSSNLNDLDLGTAGLTGSCRTSSTNSLPPEPSPLLQQPHRGFTRLSRRLFDRDALAQQPGHRVVRCPRCSFQHDRVVSGVAP
ncbi:Receptor kinase TMK4 [Spatholobus suberectus]|nr:Receptor kinase TMK4 [Spatholobus suberectus]